MANRKEKKKEKEAQRKAERRKLFTATLICRVRPS
jgi:hypothetical protein